MSVMRLFLLATGALLGLALHAQTPAPAPAAAPNRFRVRIEARDKAATYDVWLTHFGLAQPDGREVEVTGPDGNPVSHFVSSAGDERLRLLLDGAPGPGTYTVTFGTVETKLPPLPVDGLVRRGRPDWAPVGGYACVTYKATVSQNDLRPRLMNAEQVQRVFTEIGTAATAAQAALAGQAPAKTTPVPCVLRSLSPSSAATLPGDPGEMVPGPDGKPVRADNRFVHIVSGTVDLPEAGECSFAVERRDNGGGDLRVLVFDGDTARTAVKGWYSPSWGYTVSTATGTMSLRPGRHTFAFFTFMNAPEIRIRLGSPNAPLEPLDGRFAVFEQTAAATAGTLEATDGTLADAALGLAKLWLERGEFTRVRRFCQRGATLFPGQADALAKLAALSQAAHEAAGARFWTMEGKVPGRTGAVEGVRFGPPFKLETRFTPRSFHDLAGLSGALWLESGLVYGLPFAVLPDAWCITSGTCYEDGVLYVGMRQGRMLAVDYAGAKLKWSFPGEGPCTGSPLLYRGVLYYGALDRRLYALDASRGRMLWSFPTRGWLDGSPAAAGDTVFFGARDGTLYAVDAKLGVERWHAALDGPILGTPACSDGRVFIGTQAGTFYALAAADGKTVWSAKAAGAIEGGACVAAGRVCFGDRGGRVHCLDAVSGKPAWPQPCQVGGPVTAAPIFVGDAFYGGTADGAAYWGIDAADGTLGWSQPVFDAGDVHRPALFADGHLVFLSRPQAEAQRPGPAVGAVFVSADPPAQPCPRAAGPVQVDGVINDDAWRECPVLPAFRKSNGMSAGEVVLAKVAWDDTALYIALVCRTANVVVGTSGHDAAAVDGNAVRILLDPRGTGLAVADFTVTAAGVRSDRLLTGVNRDATDATLSAELKAARLEQTGNAWEPEWKAAVSVQGLPRQPGVPVTGWTAEIAIPFAALPAGLTSPPRPGQTWRLNLVVTEPATATTPARALYLAPNDDPVGPGARWLPLGFAKEPPAKK